MKKLISVAVLGALFATEAFAPVTISSTGKGSGSGSGGADHSYKTRGDMTDEELAVVFNLRDKYDDLSDALIALDKKLGNAVLTSSLGLVLDGAALGTGIADNVKDAKKAKSDAKRSADLAAELDKLPDKELMDKYEIQFIADCEADKKKNPGKYMREEPDENGITEVTCESLLVVGSDKDAVRAARVQYLVNREAGGASFDQTMNWVRMGAAAGGTVTGIATAALVASAEKDVTEINSKIEAFNSELNGMRSKAMQARTEGRSNNPMLGIGECLFKNPVTLEHVQNNLKKAKILPIVGTIASGGSAIASGVLNAKPVSEKSGLSKGMSIGSTAAAGVGGVMNGVGIGVIAFNKKQVKKSWTSLLDCEEWLWWDNNGNAFETAGGGACTEPGRTSPTPGQPPKPGDPCGAWCGQYQNPGIISWAEPGKSCKISGCNSGYREYKYNDIGDKGCYKECRIANGNSVQFWIPPIGKDDGQGTVRPGWQTCGSSDLSLTTCDPGYVLKNNSTGNVIANATCVPR